MMLFVLADLTVLQQIVHSGIFAAGQSYASRLAVVRSFQEFYKEYHNLAGNHKKPASWQSMSQDALKAHCEELKEEIVKRCSEIYPTAAKSLETIKIGAQNVLLQEGHLKTLSDLSYRIKMSYIVR